MSIDWTDDPTAFAESAWPELVDADPEGTFFHTPRYLKLYWEEFGAGDLRIAFVREGSDLVAAAAFEVADGTLTFLGGFDVTDYMGPVGSPEHRDRAAKEIIASLSGMGQWDTADLRGLLEKGTWLPALVAAARDAGIASEVRRDDVDLFLSLPGSFEEYLARLSSKKRHEIRRKDRRLRQELPSARLVDATAGSLSADLDRFVDMHRASTGPKGRFMRHGMELFFRRLGTALVPDGAFRLVFLEADGERPAGAVAFRWGSTLLLYNSVYDRSRRALGPGMILVVELIREAIDRGCLAVDLLTGDLQYKHQLGARPRHMARLLLRRG